MRSKQELARARNWTKARLMGAYVDISVLTPKEIIIMKKIESLRKDILDDWVVQSRLLGLNAKYRCPCGGAMKDGEETCGKEVCVEYSEWIKNI